MNTLRNLLSQATDPAGRAFTKLVGGTDTITITRSDARHIISALEIAEARTFERSVDLGRLADEVPDSQRKLRYRKFASDQFDLSCAFRLLAESLVRELGGRAR